jgi:hypothetical protein
MSDDRRDVIDAEFKVIREPRPQRRPWFDWQTFLIVAALSVAAVLRHWLPPG